ncbi:ubiquitin ligase protein phf9 fanconi anemia group l protein [Holotrichia oblita]|uniref:Ubiquitin ligase protein phf9 fanconi anemia group l protein n=1 Tax=Holotrichia oblita TaxID=644536 RepID=A0ACB9SJB4_HOLOL|nr:ubiquitin ligase protein phf9 fanconi anemia group l protein [Holotrichia oblita]
MTSYELDLLLKYPMIMQRSTTRDEEYFGYIKIKGDHYKIRLTRNMKRFKLEMTEDLEKYEKDIKKLSKLPFMDPVEYLDKLTEILSIELPIRKENDEITVDNTSIYRKVLREYTELRQFYFNIHKSFISKDLKTIDIIQLDERMREHSVKIEVNYTKDGKLFKIVECNLPQNERESSLEDDDSLIVLYERFMNRIDCPELQSMFDLFDEIDKFCWVIDPEKPTRKDLYRRIVLDTNLSMVIVFNPSEIRHLPEIKFLGPHNAVKKYKEIVSRNFLNWNPNEDVLSELLKLLEIDNFPSKPEHSEGDELLINDGECCICFSLRLNEQLPDIVCSNTSCNQFFHSQCLYEWLRSLNSRKFYHEICGQCPNCEKTIRCSLPTTE